MTDDPKTTDPRDAEICRLRNALSWIEDACRPETDVHDDEARRMAHTMASNMLRPTFDVSVTP